MSGVRSIKKCYWRWSWKYWWFQHQFEIISDKTQLNFMGTGSHIGERRCVNCGLHQKISNTLGYLFLDEEIGGK